VRVKYLAEPRTKRSIGFVTSVAYATTLSNILLIRRMGSSQGVRPDRMTAIILRSPPGGLPQRDKPVFLQAAPQLEAGCILLDIQMPRMGGLEVQEQLNTLGVRLPVIVMTGHGDVTTAVRAMKAGAIDFVEKPFDDGPLVAMIESALANPWQQRQDLEVARATERVATLSPREYQVLISLLAGNPNKVIAHDLAIRVRTVEVHRARMLERLGVRTLAEAIRLGVLAGLR
jgi:two-component system response regulator FixJ